MVGNNSLGQCRIHLADPNLRRWQPYIVNWLGRGGKPNRFEIFLVLRASEDRMAAPGSTTAEVRPLTVRYFESPLGDGRR